MAVYILKRIGLIFPTLFGIMVINFLIVQTAPGGPVERVIAQLTGEDTAVSSRMPGSGSDMGPAADLPSGGSYEGTRGLDPEFIAELEREFGFDKPLHERFFMMMWSYIRLDFGQSYYQDREVVDLVLERLPVSISLGFWTLLITYGISIPLGIRKAVRDG